jgi:hypothetical protein
MSDRLIKRLLVFCIGKLYSSEKQKAQLKIDINNDTWLGAHCDSGGHLLAELKPITDYEIISILNALKGNKSVTDDAVSSKKETYYKEHWL